MKQLLVFQGPASSRSGYGDHSRDLLSSLIKMDRFEVKIFDMPWGVCPRDGLKNGEHDEIIRRLLKDSRLESEFAESKICVIISREFIKNQN